MLFWLWPINMRNKGDGKMNQMTNAEYQKDVNQKTPNSSLAKDMLFAFLIGGTICLIGQCLTHCFISLGIEKQTASTLTSVSLVFAGAFLTGLGIYDKIAKIAGAGTIVPITGFANAVVSPAMEFKSEGYVLGLAAKMFIIAGPVIVYGVLSSVVVGILYYMASVL